MRFKRPVSLQNTANHYCPGCGHGIIHRIIAEVIDEMELREKVISIAPVGCAVFAYFYWNFDTAEAPHGRPPAIATAIKRLIPDNTVFTYQGDGDLAAIGGNELLHAANRGENISIFFVNNACYGMTGGQMAPTTVEGQTTTTTPAGRDPEFDGAPLKVSELLSSIDSVAYVERVAVDTPPNIMKAKKAVKKALNCQLEKKGFSLVEFLSMCPTGWKVGPSDGPEWLRKNLMRTFPLGVYKENI